MSGMAMATRLGGATGRAAPKRRVRQWVMLGVLAGAVTVATLAALRPAQHGAGLPDAAGSGELRVLGDRLLAAREALAAFDGKSSGPVDRDVLQSLERQRLDLERQHAELKARRGQSHATPDVAEAVEVNEQLAGIRAALVKVYESQGRAQQQLREHDRLREEVSSLARQYREAEARLQQVQVAATQKPVAATPATTTHGWTDRFLPTAWPALLALGAIIAMAAVGVVLGMLTLVDALVHLARRLLARGWLLAGALTRSLVRMPVAAGRATAAVWRRRAAARPANPAPAPVVARVESTSGLAAPTVTPTTWVAVASSDLLARSDSTARPARPTRAAATNEPLRLSLIDPVPHQGPVVVAASEPFSLTLRPLPQAEFSNDRQVLLVTSADHVAAKADVACRIATSFAQQGRRVLLIEADLRHPQLTHSLRMSAPATGLADVLSGRRTFDDVLVRHEASGTDLLLQGVGITNPAELLFRPALAELMNTLRTRYDCIVVHVPPLMAAGDALAFAQLVDGATLVVPAGQSGSPASSDAASRLELAGIRVADVVPDASVPAMEAIAA